MKQFEDAEFPRSHFRVHLNPAGSGPASGPCGPCIEYVSSIFFSAFLALGEHFSSRYGQCPLQIKQHTRGMCESQVGM